MSTGLDALCDYLGSYLKPDQITAVRNAYVFSDAAHEGQFRRNGDPYITHPLAVADILAHMHMDHQSLMAALLHDVIEDTGIAKEELADRFGAESVARGLALLGGTDTLDQFGAAKACPVTHHCRSAGVAGPAIGSAIHARRRPAK